MALALLLDEMLSGVIAQQLRARGRDVTAIVEEPGLAGLADEDVLLLASAQGRALVTAKIGDFVTLTRRFRERRLSHASVVLVSTRMFPQDRAFVGSLVVALDRLLAKPPSAEDAVVFLTR